MIPWPDRNRSGAGGPAASAAAPTPPTQNEPASDVVDETSRQSRANDPPAFAHGTDAADQRPRYQPKNFPGEVRNSRRAASNGAAGP